MAAVAPLPAATLSHDKSLNAQIQPVLNDTKSNVPSGSKFTLVPRVDVTELADDTTEVTEEETESLVCVHEPVRKSYHTQAVTFRSEIQTHIRSVMKTSDDMLFSIREIVENLDKATHEKILFKDQYDSVCQKRDEISGRLEVSSKECIVLRRRLYDMSKARDRAEIALEAESGKLIEKEYECQALRDDLTRLQQRSESMEKSLEELTTRLSLSEAMAHERLLEYNKIHLELETMKTTFTDLFNEKKFLARELAQARVHLKNITDQLEVLKEEFKKTKVELETRTKELKTAQEDLKDAQQLKDKAVEERRKAIEERDRALQGEHQAIEDRKGAIEGRDRAIFDYQSAKTELIRDQALLQDYESRTISLESKLVIIEEERDNAVQKSITWEHFRDEIKEQFDEADARAHCLADELKEADEITKKAQAEVVEAKKTTEKVCSDYSILYIEKEKIYQQFVQSESRKNEAIAKEIKALEDLVAADAERDLMKDKYEDMEDLYQNADRECVVLRGKLDNAEGQAREAKVKEELMAHQLGEAKEAEISALREKQALTVELQSTKQSLVTVTKEKDELEERLRVMIQELETKFQNVVDEKKIVEEKLAKAEGDSLQAAKEKAGTEKELETVRAQAVEKEADLDKQLITAKENIANLTNKERELVQQNGNISNELQQTKRTLEEEITAFNLKETELTTTKKTLGQREGELENLRTDMKKYTTERGKKGGDFWIKDIYWGNQRLANSHAAYTICLNQALNKGKSLAVDTDTLGDPCEGVTKRAFVCYAKKFKGTFLDQKILTALENWNSTPNTIKIE